MCGNGCTSCCALDQRESCHRAWARHALLILASSLRLLAMLKTAAHATLAKLPVSSVLAALISFGFALDGREGWSQDKDSEDLSDAAKVEGEVHKFLKSHVDKNSK